MLKAKRVLANTLSMGALAMAIVPAKADAQANAEVSATETSLTEIIVTAQKRSESMQRVPVAVSSVSSEGLQNAAITGLADIKAAIPGLSADQGVGILILHLRGIGTVANGPGIENPVALYVDGVYYGTQNVGLIGFNNIARIEVLKGPQGTLFGRNATGGLVQVVTEDPGQTFKARGNISYGNFNALNAALYAGGPVSADLATDFALSFNRRDGWGSNLANGRDVFGVKHDIALRSKTVFTPGAAKFTLIGDYNVHEGSDNATGIFNGFRGVGNPTPVVYPRRWDTNTNVQPLLNSRSYGVSVRSEFDVGSVNVSNLVAYRDVRFDSLFDYDGGPLPITSVRILQRDQQFSNELQLSGGDPSGLRWLAGAFYYWSKASINPNDVGFSDNPLFNPSFPVGTIRIFGHQTTDSLAGFAQVTLPITDTLSLTGGARYTTEKRSLESNTAAVLLVTGTPTVPVGPTITAERRFNRPTFRGAVEFKPSSTVLLYASVNTGFKSGGYNVTTPNDPAYGPEKITAYELGEKVELFDRRVRLNTSLFYYDYKDIQVIRAEATGVGVINGARARIYGLDADGVIKVNSALDITGSVTLLDAKFRDFPVAPFATPGGGVPLRDGDASGNRLPYAPKTTFSLNGTYRLPIGDDQLVLSGTVLHSGSYYFEPDNIAKQPAYTSFNAVARFEIDNGRYYVEAFGKNISNVAVTSVVLTNPTGASNTSLQPPRTYGITLGFKM